MQDTTNRSRPPQEKLPLIGYGDGYLESFAPKHVNVKIVQCPIAFNSEMKRTAEDFLELSLRPAWRALYYPANCQAAAMLRPLLPTEIADARVVTELLKTLNSLGEKAA